MTTTTRDRQPSEGQALVDFAPIDLESSAQRLTRFEQLARTIRAMPQAARAAHATELNELPGNDPWGRATLDWNFGREPTYGERVPNPKGDFWKLWEGKQ